MNITNQFQKSMELQFIINKKKENEIIITDIIFNAQLV